MRAILIVFFCAVSFHQLVTGLKCYSCSLVLDENAVDPDLTCVNTPANATGKPIVACPSRMKYCTIVRNDFTTTGGISSFVRGCQEKPDILNDDIESPALITHYRSCTTDLCNKGDGLQYSGGGVDDGGNPIGAIIVDDRSGGMTTCAALLLVIASFCVLVF